VSILLRVYGISVSFLVVSGRNASDPYCPASQFGYFADPTNCSRYALCYNGRLTGILQCPPDLHWHVTENGYGFCDLPSSAECQLTSVPDPTGPREPVSLPNFNARCLSSDDQSRSCIPTAVEPNFDAGKRRKILISNKESSVSSWHYFVRKFQHLLAVSQIK